MARITRLERVLDDGYPGAWIGSELEVKASYGVDVL
jgi:hypothetical protein